MRYFVLILHIFSLSAYSAEVITRVIDTGAGHASVTKMSNGQIMIFDAGCRSIIVT